MDAMRKWAKEIAKDYCAAWGDDLADFTPSWIYDMGYADALAEQVAEEVKRLMKRVDAQLEQLNLQIPAEHPNPVAVVQSFLHQLGFPNYEGIHVWQGSHENLVEMTISGLPKSFNYLLFRAIPEKI